MRENRTFWPGKKSGKVRVRNVNGATSDPDKANISNNHFVNTGDRIQATMSPGPTDQNAFQRQILPQTLEFEDGNLDDVLIAINKL